MQERIFAQVITIGDIIDSTVMYINKGNPLFAREGIRQAGEGSNPANSDPL